MPRFRIKVKTLLVVLIVLGILILGKAFVGQQILYQTANYSAKVGDKDKSIVYYTKYIREFPNTKKALNAMEKILDQTIHHQHLMLLFSESSFGSSTISTADRESLENMNQTFDILIQNHDLQESQPFNLQMRMAKFNVESGDLEKAIEYYNELIDIPAKGDQAKVGLANLYLQLGQIDQMEEVLKTVRDSNEPDVIGLKAWLSLVKGDLTGYKGYQGMLEEWYEFNHEFDTYITKEIMDQVYQNKIGEKVNLEGYILNGDQPLANVVVGLKTLENINWYSSMFQGSDYITVTDETGYYKFADVEAGRYDLGIGVSFWRVYDRVYRKPHKLLTINPTETLRNDLTFGPALEITTPRERLELDELREIQVQWKPYSGADYYRVYLGTCVQDGESESKASHKIAEVHKTEAVIRFDNIGPMAFGVSFNQKGINPYDILGSERAPTTFFYYVEAYNDQDQLLSKSIDLDDQHWIYYAGKELSEADQLLLNRKYEEAIAAYEEILLQNPNDQHSLEVLSNLYQQGYKWDEDDPNVMVGRDPSKAFEYLERLYELNRDSNLVLRLAQTASGLKKWEKANHYYKKALVNEPENGWVWYYYGQTKLYTGDLSEAKEAFQNSLEFEKTNRANERLFILYLLEGENEKALYIAENYPDESSHYASADYPTLIQKALKVINKEEVIEFYNLIKVEELQQGLQILPDTDTGNFYRTLAQITSQNIHEDFTQWYHRQNNSDLQELLLWLGRDMLRSNFPDEY